MGALFVYEKITSLNKSKIYFKCKINLFIKKYLCKWSNFVS